MTRRAKNTNAVTVGAVLLLTGLIACAVGYLAPSGEPGQGANIGAGMLILASIPLSLAGLVVLVVGLVLRRRG